jgi:hypothetical protein
MAAAGQPWLRFRQFFSLNAQSLRGLDTHPDTAAADVRDGNHDVLADTNAFTEFARKYEHDFPP